MSQSPELAGGEGFTFEGHVAAFYLAALLAERGAPGCDGIVTNVAVQQRDFEKPLDDVIVGWKGASGQIGTLSLQVKRALTISSAATNGDFRDIIRDSISTLKNSQFKKGVDKYGAAVGTIATNKFRDLTTLCNLAKESNDAKHFFERFTSSGNASDEQETIKNDIEALLKDICGGPISQEELHSFLSHFIVIKFDFLHDGDVDSHIAEQFIGYSLATADRDKYSLVWSHLNKLARASAGKAGQFDRKRLVQDVSKVVKLRIAPSFEQQLDVLNNLGRSYINLIPHDINGFTISRKSLEVKLETTLLNTRFLQITGLPGSGKSVLLKQMAEKSLANGNIFFLKSDQLIGNSWINYSAQNGVATHNLEELLLEIKVTGTPTLFIDGIDRIEKQNRPIIEEVVNTILNSPALEDWKIVVTLRDTGIEPLRNWLGHILDKISVDTVQVSLFNEEESQELAVQFPNLRALLFGSPTVKDVIRRPFFARVMSTFTYASSFKPQSELELIQHWWDRGGYNALGQELVSRHSALLELAEKKVKNLTRPIKIRELNQAHSLIESFHSDGLIQISSSRTSVNFSHDIFFEWSLLYVLIEQEENWLTKIEEFGQPPAIARVVELLAQFEYFNNTWSETLKNTKFSTMRSQWLRAWLLGPIGHANFLDSTQDYMKVVSHNNFTLLGKVLVWFQAEKTISNPIILKSKSDIRIADNLAWPSDISLWNRLINFILGNTQNIPKALFPNIVTLFNVWQNLHRYLPNRTTPKILTLVYEWLSLTGNDISGLSEGWVDIDNIKDFRESLVSLILTAAEVYPEFTNRYLVENINSMQIEKSIFKHVIDYSPLLALTHSTLLVDFTLKYLLEDLPIDQLKMILKDDSISEQNYESILYKSKTQRTTGEQSLLDSSTYELRKRRSSDLSKNLCIKAGSRVFDSPSPSPSPSPSKEPFHSLFQHSATEALRLITLLSNHAITAWRQQQRITEQLSPIPLELDFPWGKQIFWGNQKEYIWNKHYWTPPGLACAYMALECWCSNQIRLGEAPDQLIERIVKGNTSIAILGIAVTIVLDKALVSQTALPLIGSQKILEADLFRMKNDLSFNGTKELLIGLFPRYIFQSSDDLKESFQQAILAFKDNLAFDYHEQIHGSETIKNLEKSALKYAELADPLTYNFQKTDDPKVLTVTHNSPSASLPENVKASEESYEFISQIELSSWVEKSFENGVLSDKYSIQSAIEYIKKYDSADLFQDPCDDFTDSSTRKRMRQCAVSAVVAAVLKFRTNIFEEDISWARGVIERARLTPINSYELSTPDAVYSTHPLKFVAKGLSAEFEHETSSDNTLSHLFNLIAHPSHEIAITGLTELLKFWDKDSKKVWAAIYYAFSLCHDHLKYKIYREFEKIEVAYNALYESINTYFQSDEEWMSLPVPSAPWKRLEDEVIQAKKERDERIAAAYRKNGFPNFNFNDHEKNHWVKADVGWDTSFAEKIISVLPIETIIQSSSKIFFLDFVSDLVKWTIEKVQPSWQSKSDRFNYEGDLYEWVDTLGALIGKICSVLSLEETKLRFLDPILTLKGDICWDFLRAVTNAYVSASLYKAEKISEDAVPTILLFLERFLRCTELQQGSHRAGEFHGIDLPEVAKILMFTNVEHDNSACRYINGDWSEIRTIMPVIDRFVREAGWSADIMHNFLTLCERAKEYYPSEVFSDQILHIISVNGFSGWEYKSLYARISELVQHFSDRDSPLEFQVRQKMLEIIDWQIDMGDRRSAALQLSETFREVYSAA
ncbi:AAA family ATPase [Acinetobacter sp. WCHAc010034]|uniref:AAA family ATPase n=1 Tax=Acinetobacter sp. WCHAc010034 TaxID=1879049 RepID=UPI00083A12B1|nr:AAA family ATPase [Acinetobacter sp. WCHAc010034]AYA02718.1 AAA family ATPase [Acinetobacter sp. WCHAc010034]